MHVSLGPPILVFFSTGVARGKGHAPSLVWSYAPRNSVALRVKPVQSVGDMELEPAAGPGDGGVRTRSWEIRLQY